MGRQVMTQKEFDLLGTGPKGSAGTPLVKKVTVDPPPAEASERIVLARAIIDISDAVQALRRDGLSERAIIVLVHDYCKGRVGKPAIEDVIVALDGLKERYTR